jgi:hypothetical protein
VGSYRERERLLDIVEEHGIVEPMDATLRRRELETAADLSPLAMLLMALETEPITLLGLYVGLAEGAVHLDLAHLHETAVAEGMLVAALGPVVVVAAVLGALVTATGWVVGCGHISLFTVDAYWPILMLVTHKQFCRWVSHEISHWPNFRICSAHGLWTIAFRATEALSRVLALAVFCTGFRLWVLLLVFLETLLFSQLNLCDKCGHVGRENPEGDHLSSRAHACYIVVACFHYVGSPEHGPSCLCKPGVVVSATKFFGFRTVEFVVFALLFALDVDDSPRDFRP